MPEYPLTVQPVPTVKPQVPPRRLVQEVWLVFALSLGAAGLRALIDLLGALTSGRPLGAGAGHRPQRSEAG